MELVDYKRTFSEFLASGTDHLWLIDPEVYFDGDWAGFKRSLHGCNADFLATEVRARADDPDWNWWSTLKNNDATVLQGTGAAALLPLARVNRLAAKAILTGIESGWCGHPEALLPTLVDRAGLKIEDIGGVSRFTPPERKEAWYNSRTWRWRGPVEHLPGLLHFPVPLRRRTFAQPRLSLSGAGSPPRMLYASPVGEPAIKRLVPPVVDVFQKAGAECLFLQYDEAEFQAPPEVRVIRDQGFKWQLAVRHLHPDTLSEYDYIFFWDDDLAVDGFDPARFVRIMQLNHLEMAQPAIQSVHRVSHGITKQRPCPPPWRRLENESVHSVVGRLTNFVEIMVPVFTREAWRAFYSYLDPENRKPQRLGI